MIYFRFKSRIKKTYLKESKPLLLKMFLFGQFFLAIRRRQRREYVKAKLELQEMVEDFYQRFALTYRQMRLKHRKQLERFKITQMKNGNIPLKHPNGTWV